jgi:hypothetical protein
MTDRLADIADAITRDGFAYVHAPEMRAVLQKVALRDWDGFARSWGDLGVDTYMADGGRYRRRRFAAFRAAGSEIVRKPHQPHYQSRDYNPLNGGLERWFEPVTDAIGEHSGDATSDLQISVRSADPASVRPDARSVEIHQFRIEARPGQEGRLTPRACTATASLRWCCLSAGSMCRAARRASMILRNSRYSFTLTEPLDAAFTDDNRVFHGVTPIEPLDPAQPGHRDVIVVTFSRE